MNDVPALPVELIDVEHLIPYENNTKRHTDEKIRKLSNSLREHGWIGNPIQVNPDMVILAGHGRRLAALKNGWEKVPVIIRRDLDTEAKQRKFRIDDNETSKGEDIAENLAIELQFLDESGVNLLTTFDERDLEFALGDLGEMDLSALTDDIANEVEQLSNDTQEAIETENEKEYGVAKVLGFSKVNKEQQRWIQRMRMFIESETGTEGPVAWSIFAREHLGLEPSLTDD